MQGAELDDLLELMFLINHYFHHLHPGHALPKQILQEFLARQLLRLFLIQVLSTPFDAFPHLSGPTRSRRHGQERAEEHFLLVLRVLARALLFSNARLFILALDCIDDAHWSVAVGEVLLRLH